MQAELPLSACHVLLLMRTCLCASLSRFLKAAALIIGVSGSLCGVRAYTFFTKGFKASVTLAV
jgi:hypothetical protein